MIKTGHLLKQGLQDYKINLMYVTGAIANTFVWINQKHYWTEMEENMQKAIKIEDMGRLLCFICSPLWKRFTHEFEFRQWNCDENNGDNWNA